MKKNFMAIAALLIVAMLLVVSCSQEVAPKAEANNGLVEAKIGVGISSRDIAIDAADENTDTIIYKYTLEPMWQELENGTPIVGRVTTATTLGSGTLSGGLTSTNTNKLVTPGLWKVTVFGYVTADSQEKLVLKGASTAYFVNGGGTATVYVAPVANQGTGTVTITLNMQDLGSPEANALTVSITNLNNASSIVGENVSMVISEGKPGNVYTYTAKTGTAEGITVQSGFNKITISTPESAAGKGGITKTFLMIPGHTLNITGSVYPSEFTKSEVVVSVLDTDGASLVVTGATSEKVTITVPAEDTTDPAEDTTTVVELYKYIGKEGSATFTYNESTELNRQLADLGKETFTASERTYQWYVGNEVAKGTSNTSSYTFASGTGTNTYKPGDYAVTCVTTYTFTKDDVEYKFQVSATEGKFRVKP